ncbi:MAG: Ig-like domain-containing protein [Pirellulaceae bacterium]
MLAPVLVSELEPNNLVREAQALTLGTGPNQNPEVTVSGSFDAGPADYYKFDLIAGDVFSARMDVSGANTIFSDIDLSLGKLNSLGTSTTEYRGTDSIGGLNLVQPPLVPPGSPVLTGGDLYFNYVIPETGTYTFRVGNGNSGISPLSPTIGTYNLDFQTLRSTLETQPIGSHQILFLDFDGGLVDLQELGDVGTGINYGTARLPSLVQSLEDLGFEITNENRLIDGIIAEMEENFRDIADIGPNGDFDATGTPGHYKLEILNSRDHEDPWGLPNVPRVFMTGAGADINITGAFGIASSLDVGNMVTEETGFVFVEEFLSVTTVGDVFGIPHSVSVSTLDVLAKAVGAVTAHEAGHLFGLRHTENSNPRDQIMDTGGNLPGLMGVGFDGIFGTADDVDTDFGRDNYNLEPDTLGIQDSVSALAFGLATGRSGGSINGRVFNDINRDGRGVGDLGLAGVTVFGDLNGNGTLDSGEPRAVTNATGNYSLPAAAGTFRIVAQTPTGFSATTATVSDPITAGTTNLTGPDFGFGQVNFNITGVKWNDTDGDGIRDAGEPGIGGVLIYIDEDGDDRIDLFERQVRTNDDGTYNLNFPGPGTYTIREVIQPGFRQTFPATGEHVVVYNGTSLTTNYNFGNQPARDFGDLPAPYATLLSQNGPSHGFSATIGLGATTDIESDGQVSAAGNANGDDLNGTIDDEDGIELRSALAPGATAQFNVTARNGGQSAFLQGWIDFDQNGIFSDNERIFTNRTLAHASQTITTDIPVPVGTSDGPRAARFRYGPELNLPSTGFSTAGEVEDYFFSVQATTQLAQPDSYADDTHPAQQDFIITRNSPQTQLRVLANDSTFDPSIRVVSVNPLPGTTGTISPGPGGQSVLYAPRTGFTGEDSFEYTVVLNSGQSATARVTVNVVLAFDQPIAVDDFFTVPVNPNGAVALPVLENDSASNLGGMRITGVGSSSFGGTITFTNTEISYLPATGFSGTDQFTYTVFDSSGFSSTAEVTVQMNPNSFADQVEYTVRVLDLNNQPIEAVNVGDLFKVQVLVDDTRNLSPLVEGMSSAYVDLLFGESVTTIPPLNPGALAPLKFNLANCSAKCRRAMRPPPA